MSIFSFTDLSLQGMAGMDHGQSTAYIPQYILRRSMGMDLGTTITTMTLT